MFPLSCHLTSLADFGSAILVSDYVGRTYLAARPSLFITNHTKLLFAAIARIIFIPLFLLCNTVVDSNTHTRPVPFFNSDLVYWMILTVFGLSNGYVASMAMVLASSPLLNPLLAEDEKELSGTLAGFCLTAGLAVGSLASFVVGSLMHR